MVHNFLSNSAKMAAENQSWKIKEILGSYTYNYRMCTITFSYGKHIEVNLIFPNVETAHEITNDNLRCTIEIGGSGEKCFTPLQLVEVLCQLDLPDLTDVDFTDVDTYKPTKLRFFPPGYIIKNTIGFPLGDYLFKIKKLGYVDYETPSINFAIETYTRLTTIEHTFKNAAGSDETDNFA